MEGTMYLGPKKQADTSKPNRGVLHLGQFSHGTARAACNGQIEIDEFDDRADEIQHPDQLEGITICKQCQHAVGPELRALEKGAEKAEQEAYMEEVAHGEPFPQELSAAEESAALDPAILDIPNGAHHDECPCSPCVKDRRAIETRSTRRSGRKTKTNGQHDLHCRNGDNRHQHVGATSNQPDDDRDHSARSATGSAEDHGAVQTPKEVATTPEHADQVHQLPLHQWMNDGTLPPNEVHHACLIIAQEIAAALPQYVKHLESFLTNGSIDRNTIAPVAFAEYNMPNYRTQARYLAGYLRVRLKANLGGCIVTWPLSVMGNPHHQLAIGNTTSMPARSPDLFS